VTEAEFRIFESVGALVVVLDADGRIVYWNHSCSDLTGYSLDEVRRRRLWDFLLPPDEVEGVKAAFGELPVSTRPNPHANHWVTKTGERRWIVFSHSVTRHADWQIQYIIKTGIDRTESKQATDVLRSSAARLGAHAVEVEHLYDDARRVTDDLREANQHMVSATIRAQESTEKMAAALLRAEESQRELRAIAELRERFIGIVSHDLRNPLGAIALATDVMLHRGRLDGVDQQAVARIVASSARMTRMILQLLDFTRVRLGGGIPLEAKPIDLRDVYRDVVEEFGTAVRLEVEGDVTGSWDPDRLTEALSNIARNAVEHAAPGTPVVARAHVEGAEVVVEISNQGEPIPPELIPFIFDPFRRGKRDRLAGGNLGLGLYIAKQIALASRGTLDARCGDGETTFVMRLPRAA
jgi:PAS domain S-box-containing protein